MPRIIIVFSFLAVVMGCATTARNDGSINVNNAPPLKNFLTTWNRATTTELEALTIGTKEQNLAWWKDYRLAQAYSARDKNKSCDLYNGLYRESEFPLRDLALLRAQQVCPNEKKTLLTELKTSSWFRDLSLDIRLAEKEDIATLIEKARSESNLKRKEQSFEKALALAKTDNNTSEIANIEKQLFHIAPRFIPQPEPKELIRVAYNFRSNREFDKAIASYQQAFKSTKTSVDVKFQALKGIRQTYKIMVLKNDYVAATADLVKWTKKLYLKNKKDFRSAMRFHDSQVLLARALWTEGQTTQAVRQLNETRRLLKGVYPLDEVYFLAGRIQEEKGNINKALEYYEGSYNEKISQSGLKDKILWLKSWNYYKLGKYDEAIISFQEMKEKTKDNSDQARASFWLARCYNLTNQPLQATTELEALTQKDPLGYYGLLGYRELKIDMPALSFSGSEELNLTMLTLNEVESRTRLAIEWLIAVNEKSFVEKMLNEVVTDLKQKNVTDDDTWLTVSSTYARAGLYLPLFAAIGTLPPATRDQLLANHPDLIFPLPYAQIIKAASENSGTPAAYIYSIMRQESAFNPEARSPVDAMGLMQLLPSVAKNIARDNKLPYKESDDLFSPEVNIPLGAFELKTLMKRHKNQFILASAAYNASGKAIRGWLKHRYRPDPVEFIEEVPYEETRSYIKLVMRNYAFYERLLNKNAPTAFPERLLKFSQTETAN